MTVRCECGRREERVVCMMGGTDYSKTAAQAVATRLWEKQSIDIAVLKKDLKNRRSVYVRCEIEKVCLCALRCKIEKVCICT